MKKDRAADCQTVESLKGLWFAAEKGSAGEAEIAKLGNDCTPTQDQATALLEVQSGTADAAVIDYLMDEAGFNRVWAYHDAQNPKSGRVMIKCGMRYEGTLRQAGLNKDKQIIDKVVYSILKSDARRKDALV